MSENRRKGQGVSWPSLGFGGGRIVTANDDDNALPDYVAVDPQSNDWLCGKDTLSAQDLPQAHAKLKALCALGQAVYLNRTPDQILEAAMVFLDALLCPERCILAVFGDDDQITDFRCTGLHADVPMSDLPVSQSILRMVREDYVAVLSTDAQKDTRLKEFKSVRDENIRSVLCVPLGTESDVRGIVYLDSRIETKAFNKDDLLFLTAVCRFLDLGIHHATQLQDAKEQARLSEQRLVCLREELFQKHKIIGNSRAIVDAYQRIKQIASAPLSIVLTGETGTGKELFAHAVHLSSPRADAPFVVTNLAAINANLIESELFGHEAGAFTGAYEKRLGLLERADGGTLFLDEIARAPKETQFKLLRAIEQKKFERVGGNELLRSDFRVIAATSQDLQTMMQEGQILPDLYFRLAEATVSLPALRERTEDIPLLVDHFLKQERIPRRFSPQAIEVLKSYAWPGNIRQLRSTVLGVACVTDDNPIDSVHVREHLRIFEQSTTADALVTLSERLADAEREHILLALETANGNKNEAIKLLGMARATFFERLKRYRL